MVIVNEKLIIAVYCHARTIPCGGKGFKENCKENHANTNGR